MSPVRVIGGKQCRQPKVEEIEAVFSCTVGSLAKGASVQMTVSFQMGRIAGRSIYLDMIPHTGSRDPKAKNNEAIVSAVRTSHRLRPLVSRRSLHCPAATGS